MGRLKKLFAVDSTTVDTYRRLFSGQASRAKLRRDENLVEEMNPQVEREFQENFVRLEGRKAREAEEERKREFIKLKTKRNSV
jgi:VIT1/CCC1 family predicted Fe2+/Mn2+ transporter